LQARTGETGVVDSHGRFVWYELMTTDVAAAKAFYAKVVGWGVVDVSMPGMAYALFTAGKTSVSGILGLAEDARKMGAKPRWLGYVGVNDVDASAKRAKQLGGTVHVPPTDIPNISRFSIVADPQMATLALFKGQQPVQQQPAGVSETGRMSWHELIAADWEKAFAFYADLFGWQKADADVGPMGTYQVFSVEGQAIGGMFTKPPVVPIPFWLYYFSVDDIDAATERVLAGGGQILEGPLEVPGGSWITRCMDPQGAMFALEGKRNDNAIGASGRGAARHPSAALGGRWYWWVNRQ
jgi:predicted enzyme related to lactoylglutathione lyase